MAAKLFILDDQASIRESLESVAKALSVPTITFASGVEGLTYLTELELENLPKVYFVDMRIPGGEEESESPLDIYHFLKDKGKVDAFYFMTSHMSEHDEMVIAETGASVITKDQPNKLYAIIQWLAGK